VETEIGTTLREARIRHKVDLAEIEQRTKIRVRYLRALENEEWDLLPGPTYTRSFIRTYASFLGLDGERLADDFRHQQELQAVEAVSGREPHALPPRLARIGDGPRIGAGFLAALAAAALVVVLLVLGLTGGSSNDRGGSSSEAAKGTAKHGKGQQTGVAKHRSPVSISLTASAEVWVCALASDGTPVVNGEILTTGTQRGPFRSGKFDLAFGNGAVDLEVDGKPFQIKDTPSPVGYEVTRGGVRLLPEGTRPDCT
jgi:transcriptional regulator with XRE-family HTH domain